MGAAVCVGRDRVGPDVPLRAQGGQIAWLIPTAIILGVVALAIVARVDRAKTDGIGDDNRKPLTSVSHGEGLWLIVTVGRLQLHGRHLPTVTTRPHSHPQSRRSRRWRGRGLLMRARRAVLGAGGSCLVAVGTAAIWGFVLLGRPLIS